MSGTGSTRTIREALFPGRPGGAVTSSGGVSDERAVQRILERHGRMASQIIAILQDLQALCQYLPEAELRFISREIDVPLTRLYAIATFYKAFRLVPRGRHEISLCTGTACHVRGAMRVKDAIERELKVAAGGTTPDMRFSFETVRCLGCCGQAPVMMVDGELVSRLDHLTIGKALEKYK
ncbi:MAG: NAD(P)H-dependent oxidoreductase subunit E [Candidatus Krumholzibacteria bacterium]|nr:NAD(P)H-dependent oxidoreductase subunit E [Candidatus Krumholzibacteria bacterium]